MTEVVADIHGVVVHIDNVLVFGRDKEEHDGRLRAVLQRIGEAGLTLNSLTKLELNS